MFLGNTSRALDLTMFEDDDLDDLYLGLDPSPDPKLQPHFLGSPIAGFFPLADSTYQVFSNGNMTLLGNILDWPTHRLSVLLVSGV